MFATTIKIQRQDESKKDLFTVTIKEPRLLFFYKTKTYRNLSKAGVQKLEVPFGMFITGVDVDYDCLPERIL
jgi:hypothetical protein